VYLTYFYHLGYLYAKNYQMWWRYDEVVTKTSWVILLAHPVQAVMGIKVTSDICVVKVIKCCSKVKD